MKKIFAFIYIVVIFSCSSYNKSKELKENEILLSKDTPFYLIADRDFKPTRILREGTVVETERLEIFNNEFYNIYLPYGNDGEINIGFITKDALK